MCSVAGSFIKLFIVVICTLEEDKSFSFSYSKKPLCFMPRFLGPWKILRGFQLQETQQVGGSPEAKKPQVLP